MEPCRAKAPSVRQSGKLRVELPCCHISDHAGPHSWETEEEFLDRSFPAPVAAPAESAIPACIDCRQEITLPQLWGHGRCSACQEKHSTATRSALRKGPAGQHYRARGGIEPIDFITSNNLDFLEGNVVKYVARWRHKDGVRDLKKAQQYLQWLVERAEKAEGGAAGA